MVKQLHGIVAFCLSLGLFFHSVPINAEEPGSAAEPLSDETQEIITESEQQEEEKKEESFSSVKTNEDSESFEWEQKITESKKVITETIEGKTVSADTTAFPDNDVMLQGYLDKLTEEAQNENMLTNDLLYGSVPRRAYLSGNETIIYDCILEHVDQFLSGATDSPVVKIPVVSRYLNGKSIFTAEDLGVEIYNPSTEDFNYEAYQKFEQMMYFDEQLVIDALRADEPHKFFWMLRSGNGVFFSIPTGVMVAEIETTEDEVVVSANGYMVMPEDREIEVYLRLDKNYRASGYYEADQEKIAAAANAAASAQSIVNAASSLNDYDKLLYYNCLSDYLL